MPEKEPEKTVFPDREEALRRQKERLSSLRERVASRAAFHRIRDWFLSSGLLERTAERAADWLLSAAERPDLEELIAKSLSAGSLDRLLEAVLDTAEGALSAEGRFAEAAGPLAGWLEGIVTDDAFLWAVHGRIEKLGGATGKLAHWSGVIDYRELTWQVADAIREELERVKRGDLSELKPAITGLLAALREKVGPPEERARSLAPAIAGLFRALAPALAASVRSAKPGSIPPWAEELLHAAWSRASSGVVDAVEAVMLPPTGGEGGSAADFVAVLRSVIAPEPGAGRREAEGLS